MAGNPTAAATMAPPATARNMFAPTSDGCRPKPKKDRHTGKSDRRELEKSCRVGRHLSRRDPSVLAAADDGHNADEFGAATNVGRHLQGGGGPRQGHYSKQHPCPPRRLCPRGELVGVSLHMHFWWVRGN